MTSSKPPRRKLSRLLFVIFIIYTNLSILAEASGNGCDRYAKCRADLLEIHWKCAESSRRLTQHACKINNLFGNHKTTSYNIESIFSACSERYSAISDIDYLLETDPSCLPPEDQEIKYSEKHCWSDLMRLTQKCYSLSRCCPAANKCHSEVLQNVINEQYELEKSTMKGLLQECYADMDSLMNSRISRDDLIIAKKVGDAAKQLLRSVVPFRIFPDTKRNFHKIVNANVKPREFAAPALKFKAFKVQKSGRSDTRPRKPIRHVYGISRPKVSNRYRKRHEEPEPPTSSLRPFTSLHTGDSNFRTSSQPPAFSPFDFQNLQNFQNFDSESKPMRKNKKGKQPRRNRKKKHDFEHSSRVFQHASKITDSSRFDSHLGAKKLDKLAGNLKEKGEYGRSFLPEMHSVKQNKGKFLGYAQPYIRPIIDKPPTSINSVNTKVEEIYDDIIESQISGQVTPDLHTNDLSDSQPAFVVEKVQASTEANPTGPQELHSNEAFINNNGAWTMEPPSEAPTPSTNPFEPTPSFHPRISHTFAASQPSSSSSTSSTQPSTPTTSFSRITFPSIPFIPTTTTTEEITTPTTTETTTTDTEPPSTSTTLEIPKTSVDPFADYITHELLDKHMEKSKEDDDFDFSNADYIDISAMDVPPSEVSSFPIPRYEPSTSSTSWPLGFTNPTSSQTANPQTRTTSAPLNPEDLSEAQNNDLIPLPNAAESFGSIDITPSPWITSTPLDNQLWPLPIRKLRRLKAMGVKMMQNQKPIVIVPMGNNKPNSKKKFVKQRLFTGCQKYDKCLKKEVEMQLKCAKPYPQPFDKCSTQLLPLYKLIDEASSSKLQFVMKCVSESKEQNSTCSVEKSMIEEMVDCENLEEWSSYCRKLEKCCPAKDRCDAESEIDHSGTRLRLLEKSFSLRAAACQFRNTFHRSIVRKH